jgi:hypothetical protein
MDPTCAVSAAIITQPASASRGFLQRHQRLLPSVSETQLRNIAYDC